MSSEPESINIARYMIWRFTGSLSLEAKTAQADPELPPALTLLTRQNTCLSDLRPRIMTDKRPRPSPVPCIYLRFIRLHVPALGTSSHVSASMIPRPGSYAVLERGIKVMTR